MIRRASTAALRYSSELLSLGTRGPRHPAGGPKTEGQREVPMSCRFVLWGTLIL